MAYWWTWSPSWSQFHGTAGHTWNKATELGPQGSVCWLGSGRQHGRHRYVVAIAGLELGDRLPKRCANRFLCRRGLCPQCRCGSCGSSDTISKSWSGLDMCHVCGTWRNQGETNPARSSAFMLDLLLTEQEKVRSGRKAYIQRSVDPDGRVDGTQAHRALGHNPRGGEGHMPAALEHAKRFAQCEIGVGQVAHIPKAMTTASNDSCEKGSACASACSKRTCGYVARAIRTCVAEKSIPTASAPRVAASPAT